MLHKWTNWAAQPSFTTGRFGGFSLNTTSRNIWKTIDSSESTLISGFGFQQGGISGRFLSFWAGGGSGTIQVSFYFDNSTRKISAYRGNGLSGTLLGTGTHEFVSAVWYFIEFKITFHDTLGVVEVRVEDDPDLTLSGIDTNNGGGSVADTIFFGNAGIDNVGVLIDDLYLLDDTDSGVAGAPNDDFLGDVRVESIFPDDNGNSSQFLGSDADSTDNYLLVDEVDSDDDTTYVESSTVGEKDTYSFGDLTATAGTVYGLSVFPWARKTDAGTRTICSVARLGTSEDDSADKALAANYTYYPDIREADPDGNQWTISNVNASEFGQKVTT